MGVGGHHVVLLHGQPGSRAPGANGDLDVYWNWHITQERQRNHLSRYKDGRILAA